MTDYIIYAIGDVHGMADHLEKTVAFGEADARFYGKTPRFYFLGDIVDRGPESRRAMQIVHDTLAKHPDSVLHLGNHDHWFLDAVQTEGRGRGVQDWTGSGGKQTLASYFPGLNEKHALQGIRADYPHHIRMLRDAALITDHGRIVFCHAGVDRENPIDDQEMDDLLWIREPFLHALGMEHEVVVHGHTIRERGPGVYDNRIAIDTGAYATLRLTTCRIDPTRRTITFFQANGYSAFIEVEEVQPDILDRDSGSVFERLREIFDNWKD